jgi:hypothetical protein
VEVPEPPPLTVKLARPLDAHDLSTIRVLYRAQNISLSDLYLRIFYLTTSSSFTPLPPKGTRKHKVGRSESIRSKGVEQDHMGLTKSYAMGRLPRPSLSWPAL